VLGRTYLVMYTDRRGQVQTERGHLVSLDQEGFVVLEVNGKHVLSPKARIDALVEVERRAPVVMGTWPPSSAPP
jgi:hypothetical protein